MHRPPLPLALILVTLFGCANGGNCYTVSGTCKAAAADGAACDTAAGPPCMTPARCVTSGSTAGTCTVPSGSMCG